MYSQRARKGEIVPPTTSNNPPLPVQHPSGSTSTSDSTPLDPTSNTSQSIWPTTTTEVQLGIDAAVPQAMTQFHHHQPMLDQLIHDNLLLDNSSADPFQMSSLTNYPLAIPPHPLDHDLDTFLADFDQLGGSTSDVFSLQATERADMSDPHAASTPQYHLGPMHSIEDGLKDSSEREALRGSTTVATLPVEQILKLIQALGQLKADNDSNPSWSEKSADLLKDPRVEKTIDQAHHFNEILSGLCQSFSQSFIQDNMVEEYDPNEEDLPPYATASASALPALATETLDSRSNLSDAPIAAGLARNMRPMSTVHSLTPQRTPNFRTASDLRIGRSTCVGGDLSECNKQIGHSRARQPLGSIAPASRLDRSTSLLLISAYLLLLDIYCSLFALIHHCLIDVQNQIASNPRFAALQALYNTTHSFHSIAQRSIIMLERMETLLGVPDHLRSIDRTASASSPRPRLTDPVLSGSMFTSPVTRSGDKYQLRGSTSSSVGHGPSLPASMTPGLKSSPNHGDPGTEHVVLLSESLLEAVLRQTSVTSSEYGTISDSLALRHNIRDVQHLLRSNLGL